MATTKKEDLFLRAGKDPILIRLPRAFYLTLAGEGAPEGAAFQGAVRALYAVAYGVKFARRKTGGEDFRVPPLEGQWWLPPGRGRDISRVARVKWLWKLLIRVPRSVRRAEVDAAVRNVLARNPKSAAARIDLEPIAEDQVVQVLHVGPYSAEPETIARMMVFLRERRLRAAGPHHEIYLGDPRRAAPHKLKTILRQPVRS